MRDIDEIYNEARDRIFEAMAIQKVSQKDLAEDLGISPQTVTDWKNGKSRSFAKGQMLKKIALSLAVNTTWLIDGIGPMTKLEQAKADGSFERSERIANGENVIQLVYANKDDIKAAFFEGGEDLSPEEMDELWADAQDYIQYKLNQRRKKQDGQ